MSLEPGCTAPYSDDICWRIDSIYMAESEGAKLLRNWQTPADSSKRSPHSLLTLPDNRGEVEPKVKGGAQEDT